MEGSSFVKPALFDMHLSLWPIPPNLSKPLQGLHHL